MKGRFSNRNKRELAGFLEKKLSHYDITPGFIYDCLEDFEIKKIQDIKQIEEGEKL